jgi:23S rRNA pseudouridine1911/1915/1917 synthase
MDIPIIYEDESLMVINKPPGLVVDSSETQITGTLQEILENQFQIKLDRGGIVHRLDKDTSGLMIIAKTQDALENLQFQFKERMVKKEYIALVHGNMEEAKTVNGAIARNPARRENFIVIEDGKPAETEFVPVKRLTIDDYRLSNIFEGFNKIQMRRVIGNRYSTFTLVTCLPKTGRTHQIRVHLKYLGFPIVGDDKYGGRKTARLDKRWCPRQFLHAAKIEFIHPVTGQKLSFEAGLPVDLENVLINLTSDSE